MDLNETRMNKSRRSQETRRETSGDFKSLDQLRRDAKKTQKSKASRNFLLQLRVYSWKMCSFHVSTQHHNVFPPTGPHRERHQLQNASWKSRGPDTPPEQMCLTAVKGLIQLLMEAQGNNLRQAEEEGWPEISHGSASQNHICSDKRSEQMQK